MSAVASPSTVFDVTTIGDRLVTAQGWVKSCEETIEDARSGRDQIIIEAIEIHGWSCTQVAKTLGLSEPGIRKVLGRI